MFVSNTHILVVLRVEASLDAAAPRLDLHHELPGYPLYVYIYIYIYIYQQ